MGERQALASDAGPGAASAVTFRQNFGANYMSNVDPSRQVTRPMSPVAQRPSEDDPW